MKFINLYSNYLSGESMVVTCKENHIRRSKIFSEGLFPSHTTGNMFASLDLPSPMPHLVFVRAQLGFSFSSLFVLSQSRKRPLACRSSLDASNQRGERGQQHSRSVLMERYEDGRAKRYVLGNNLHIQCFWEEEENLINKMQKDDLSDLTLLPKFVRDFALPAYFPASVSDDYLDYMLLQFPTNVTGWICHTLVTSSLLKAIGVGSFSRAGVAASTAAIQ